MKLLNRNTLNKLFKKIIYLFFTNVSFNNKTVLILGAYNIFPTTAHNKITDVSYISHYQIMIVMYKSIKGQKLSSYPKIKNNFDKKFSVQVFKSHHFLKIVRTLKELNLR